MHPKFVTALLNDLFGIQSRAGCSCAGPYGHRLLAIGHDVSEQYRAWVRKGYQGFKPGWCRIGFHFVMDDVDADFVIEAVLFAAAQGYKFLPLYRFDPFSGAWQHRDARDDAPPLSLDAALTVQDVSPTALPAAERARLFAGYLAEARSIAVSLDEPRGGPRKVLDGAFGELQFFSA